MQTVETQTSTESSQQLEPGDQLAVSLRDGRRLELSFVEWTPEALAGTDSHGTLHRVAREDISQLEVEQNSVLGSIGVVAIALGMVFAAMSSSSNYF